VAIEIVFESHSTTMENEQGRATGWLPGELSAQGRITDHFIGGATLEHLAGQDFALREGWEYRLG
jgi:hypothetical protein